jgi:hypothetical protein
MSAIIERRSASEREVLSVVAVWRFLVINFTVASESTAPMRHQQGDRIEEGAWEAE